MNYNNPLRKIIFKVNNIIFPKLQGKDANQAIIDCINSENPCMIARVGAVEAKAILYKILPPPICYILKGYTFNNLGRNAGFFPLDEEKIKRFKNLMLEDMRQCDVLASWRPEEAFFYTELMGACKISLLALGGPVDKANIWTSALLDKRVLVVHPFADTIMRQYVDNRTNLFEDPRILPEFKSLEIVKAVQTIAGNNAGFTTWFDALEYMKKEIEKHDFDVCLIGCGAYGFPLAAHVKRMGKKAVHVGGALQLYFGIKGKRWDNSGLYNEYWVSPSENERPNGLKNVEGGCYW